MAKLTLEQIFGQYATYDPLGGELTVHISNLKNIDNGGQIANGLGLDTSAISQNNVDAYAESLLYGLILLVSQNQATSLNEDPAQKIYISDGGKRFGTGSRDGQIQRVINVNIFSDLNLSSLPDIDELSGVDASNNVNT